MTTQQALISLALAAAGCVGHQTFDDGSDELRRNRTDASAQPTEAPSDEGASGTGNQEAASDDQEEMPDDGTPDAASDSAGPITSLGPDVEGLTVSTVVGTELVLTLGRVGPGNYEAAEIEGEAVASLGSEPAPVQNPGGPTRIFRFRAESVGFAVVSIPHTAAASFVFQIDVQ